MAEETSTKTTKTRRSAARAKPKRGAASSIRTTGAPSKSSTKRKVAEAQMAQSSQKSSSATSTRERVELATNYLLEDNAEYKQKRTSWWILMAFTAALLVATLVTSNMYTESGGTNTMLGNISTITLIGSFVYTIAAFVWDWRSIRPYRREAEEQAHAMTVKKREEFIAAHEEADGQKKGFFRR